jgi:2'-5' RNA ligase
MIRSFVAIDLPDEAQNALREVGEQLRRRVPAGVVRWSRISGIHLTLKFLGDVAEADIPQIKDALSEAGQRHTPFTLTIRGIGCFPNVKKPRVVWVGTQEITGSLVALQRDIEKSLTPLGFKPEKRAYHPHLTLGRTRRNVQGSDLKRLGQHIATSNVGELSQIQVNSFRLMRSDLHPDGAIYTPLAHFPLRLVQEGK